MKTSIVNRAQDIIAKKWVVCKKNGMWTREKWNVDTGEWKGTCRCRKVQV